MPSLNATCPQQNAPRTGATLSLTAAQTYEGTNRLILGIVLAVVTFWLFAQTTLNVAPTMRDDLHITNSESNIAVSITALFSGIFIVVAGGLADQFGRVKLTYIGLSLSILGSLLIALSPPGTAMFLMAGRVIQGISAACIMPATLALAAFVAISLKRWLCSSAFRHSDLDRLKTRLLGTSKSRKNKASGPSASLIHADEKNALLATKFFQRFQLQTKLFL